MIWFVWTRQKRAIAWAAGLAVVALVLFVVLAGQRDKSGDRDWLLAFVGAGPFVVGSAVFGAVSMLLADVE